MPTTPDCLKLRMKVAEPSMKFGWPLSAQTVKNRKLPSIGMWCLHVTFMTLSFFFIGSADVSSDLANVLGQFEFEGHKIQVTRGDYSPLLLRVRENLEKAKVSTNIFSCSKHIVRQ